MLFFKHFILTIVISVFYVMPVFSTEVPQPSKLNVYIFNFKMDANIEKYLYYSIVIPKTIGRYIQQNNRYTVHLVPHEADTLDDGLGDEQKREHVKSLRKIINKNEGGDFIILGSCAIREDKKLIMKINCIDLIGKKSFYVNKESHEVGALLKDTMDELNAELNNTMEKRNTTNRAVITGSPVVSLYRGLKNISFGVEGGKMFLYGSWSERYNNGEYISPYLIFNTPGLFGASLNFDYFNTDNKGRENDHYSTMTVYAGTVSLYIAYSFNNIIYLSFSGGFGGAFTDIRYTVMGESSGPFEKPLAEKKSYDPCLSIEAALNLNMAPLQLKFGSAFKRIFFTGTPLMMYSAFIGAGYNF